ncbi:MAG: MBL fold metallo-hydrolase [Candidatus Aminicenantes bacterium]|nr:MBL fold metallo-hydrolase [Candidatus Aminicenantes bacterium]
MPTSLKMIVRRRAVLAAAVLMTVLGAGGAALRASAPIPAGQARLTILYDNTTAREGVQSDWGFACLIEGLRKTILFDTGTKPEILLANCKALAIDLNKVDAIVISHPHADHMGGLLAVLEKHSAVTLYIPAALALISESAARSAGIPTLAKLAFLGTKIIQVDKPVEICPGARLTSQIVGANLIPEIGLLLETKAGGMLITGCAHPGIVDIVRKAAAWRGKPIEAVVGGFHLMQTSEADVKKIIADMKAAGVVRCGATHCTGAAAIALFRTAFGAEFIPLGVGRVIEF